MLFERKKNSLCDETTSEREQKMFLTCVGFHASVVFLAELTPAHLHCYLPHYTLLKHSPLHPFWGNHFYRRHLKGLKESFLSDSKQRFARQIQFTGRKKKQKNFFFLIFRPWQSLPTPIQTKCFCTVNKGLCFEQLQKKNINIQQ